MLRLLIHGEPHAQAEFGVVFKERVCPRRTASLCVPGVRCRREIATVDGRAAGSVSDDQAVAKELREQLDVRSLAATGTGSGKFKKRLKNLNVLYLRVGQFSAVEFGRSEERRV